MRRDDDEALALGELIEELAAIRTAMLEATGRGLPGALAHADPPRQGSARNLAHYLALRRFDLRRLQQRLAARGLSSLGRAESHVLANLTTVLEVLCRLAGRTAPMIEPAPAGLPAGAEDGQARIAARTELLVGAPPAGRDVRIMVTLPGDAAHDDALVERMVGAGMDIARINCAHDDAAAWQAMAERVRRAGRRAGRPVRVLMDLGGPKLRTGSMGDAPAVVRMRPRRDDFGRVVEPARLSLRPADEPLPPDAGTAVAVEGRWLARLAVGDQIDLGDARGAHRRWTVDAVREGEVIVRGPQTAYLTPGLELVHEGRGGRRHKARIVAVPRRDAVLPLQRGDRIDLADPQSPPPRRCARPRVPCTLVEALAAVRRGQRVAFDDGRIGGVVVARRRGAVTVEINDVAEAGDQLRADKGINLPDTELDLPALTAQDLRDLDVAARCADLVGLSFAQSAADVRTLREELERRDARRLGIVLKIETRRGFANLPAMLFEALQAPAAGVMIARGDLAVECGYERLAEVQEEILWACEAAHVPVIWATQVLESLAKSGRPSRAEVTDAAMSARAECVMLNKGPHVVEAIAMLDDILRRMQAHQRKKGPLLRALRVWSDLAGAADRD